jgi:hypothetical protein
VLTERDLADVVQSQFLQRGAINPTTYSEFRR